MIDDARLLALESIPLDELISLIEIGTVESLQRAAALAETLPHLAAPDDETSEGEGVKPTTMEHKPPWSEGGVSVREPRRPNAMDESAGIPSAKPGYIPPPVKPGAYRIPFARYGPGKPGALRRPSLATRSHPGIGVQLYKSLLTKCASPAGLAETILAPFVKADALQGPPPPEGAWGHCLRCGSLIIQTGDEMGWRHVTLTVSSHVGVPSLPGRVPHSASEPTLSVPGVTVNVQTGSPPATDVPLIDSIEEKFRGRSTATYRRNPGIERVLRESRGKAIMQPRGPIANPNIPKPDRGVPPTQGPIPPPGSLAVCLRCGGILFMDASGGGGGWQHVIKVPSSHVGIPRGETIQSPNIKVP